RRSPGPTSLPDTTTRSGRGSIQNSRSFSLDSLRLQERGSLKPDFSPLPLREKSQSAECREVCLPSPSEPERASRRGVGGEVFSTAYCLLPAFGGEVCRIGSFTARQEQA